jgi:hypothetical protein
VCDIQKGISVNAQDIAALDSVTAEQTATSRLLGSQPVAECSDNGSAPTPPQGADLTLAVLRAMKTLNYEQKFIPDTESGGGEMYFVQREQARALPPEEEYVRYRHNPQSTATATCKAALIALNRSGRLAATPE